MNDPQTKQAIADHLMNSLRTLGYHPSQHKNNPNKNAYFISVGHYTIQNTIAYIKITDTNIQVDNLSLPLSEMFVHTVDLADPDAFDKTIKNVQQNTKLRT